MKITQPGHFFWLLIDKNWLDHIGESFFWLPNRTFLYIFLLPCGLKLHFWYKFECSILDPDCELIWLYFRDFNFISFLLRQGFSVISSTISPCSLKNHSMVYQVLLWLLLPKSCKGQIFMLIINKQGYMVLINRVTVLKPYLRLIVLKRVISKVLCINSKLQLQSKHSQLFQPGSFEFCLDLAFTLYV